MCVLNYIYGGSYPIERCFANLINLYDHVFIILSHLQAIPLSCKLVTRSLGRHL